MRIFKFFLLFFLLASSAFSQSHPIYELNWKVSNERLEYQSCGCADGCWVAKLWDGSSQKRKLKAQLRCDCYAAFARKAKGKEWQYADSCREFEGDDKNAAIISAVKKIIAK